MTSTPSTSSSPTSALPHTIIIGGGISGLSAAYELERAGLPYTLIERDERLGGKIRTERVGDDQACVIEGGPDSFVAQKPWAVELARELGIGDQIMGSNTVRRSTYVLLGGKPRPMPEGLMLIVPTRFMPFALSTLISPLGKLRMALDVIIPRRTDPTDESLASFIRRRLGNEALNRLAEPLMAGIHSADAEHQSLMATFPRFREMERTYGSLILGMLASRRKAATQPRKGTGGGSPFTTLRNGLGTLVEALIAQLHGTILRGKAVTTLEPTTGASSRYRLQLNDRSWLNADSVILAMPTYAAADLLASWQPDLAAELRAIRYVSTATITLAYRRDELRVPFDGFGMVIPHSEPAQINAVTISSRKFANRAPDDIVLLRAFVGGSRNPEAFGADDQALLAMVLKDLQRFLKIDTKPIFHRIYRWERGNPQYDLGHLERVQRIAQLSPEGLYLVGGAYQGVGIPDCIHMGREAARAIHAASEQQVKPTAVETKQALPHVLVS